MSVTAEVLEQLAATVEVCGAGWSDATTRIVVDDLSQYPPAAVVAALAMCRRECKYKLTLADIIERIEQANPSGWPLPNEAWAAVGTLDESRTLVCVPEAFEALESVRDLLKSDEVAARMAFLETYRRLVAAAKLQGRRATWAMSVGHDTTDQMRVLGVAVKQGRFSQEDVQRRLGPVDLGLGMSGEPQRLLSAGEAKQQEADRERFREAMRENSVEKLRALLGEFEDREKTARAEVASQSTQRTAAGSSTAEEQEAAMGGWHERNVAVPA